MAGWRLGAGRTGCRPRVCTPPPREHSPHCCRQSCTTDRPLSSDKRLYSVLHACLRGGCTRRTGHTGSPEKRRWPSSWHPASTEARLGAAMGAGMGDLKCAGLDV